MKPEHSKQVGFWFNFLKIEEGIWADKTFPKSSLQSIHAHMNEELAELLEAIENNDQEQIAKESADILLLLLHLSFKNETDIGKETLDKLEINRQRVWDTEPNVDGYYKHKEKE